MNVDDLKQKIRNIPNFPKPGIVFRDITTLLDDVEAFRKVIDIYSEHFGDKNITKVVAIESRGFIFGGALAYKMDAAFVPVRKLGKLPGETIKKEYELEYGVDALEMHRDAIKAGDNVLIVDDLMATGGTLAATCGMVEKLGANIAGIAVLIELSFLKGQEKFQKYDYLPLIKYDSE
ncbi:MAG: adenine phosphoribosyltransferase [candidate division Zixibacteria bacterium]|nr:adenine phosphoribosyltransferase [candidate division Zixibacteria bacterium]NIR63721.1 adenine phosphoribosyltransferase [candidate division Zixibacteria bacterium]NIS14678.1 adenine phosphoribosyltransferase [candidate division Zixibacteria bacterium]NIS45677.1 adenine phosphoribosyltransferase [candidate division Zixibacteria bacterium]NIT51206.1 adenine phosphoribosyltransferase [candidate division Zixibacteria bacterium]